MGKKIIAIIPARSGSKGLKDKNIKKLNGKHLLAYTIEAAIKSEIFDEVFVSTDSQQYADIAISYGASVPFLRNKESAEDRSSSWDVVREAITKYKEQNKQFDLFILLQPTSPLRSSKEIIEAYELYNEKKAIALVSVCEVGHPIQWCFTLGVDQNMSSFSSSPYKDYRRQDLSNYYHENGAIYINKTKLITEENFNFYESDCYAYIMEKTNSIDIDTLLDFQIAEFLLSKKENKGSDNI